VADPADRASTTNGSRRPDRSQSRFFCNLPRKIALIFFVVAFAALVIAEISTNGSPTSLETTVVRWTIVGSLAIGVVAYVIGGRLLAERSGGGH
jgi:lipopolysaccharide export LptBFGC system permease protein LptF